MVILKQEINQLNNDNFNLAKWKLAAVSSFALVGLGASERLGMDSKTGLLLLCVVGFLCAYIDTLYYRRATAIHIIAGYLRAYAGQDAELLELRLVPLGKVDHPHATAAELAHQAIGSDLATFDLTSGLGSLQPV